MTGSIDGNTTPIGPLGNVGFVPPAEVEEEKHDPTASTISQSMVESLMVSFLMGYPILPEPNSDGLASPDGRAIATMTAIGFAKIGSEMWERYAENIAEQKERTAEYLASPAYRQWELDRTMRGQVYTENKTPIDTQNPVRNASEFNQYLVSQGFSPDRINDEMHRLSSITAINQLSNGISNYIRENREENPAAVAFIVGSHILLSSLIVPDVASTEMVSVNPVQSATNEVLPLIPQQLQESFTLVINLFAIGMINFANAEAIGNAEQQGNPPSKWEAVVAFARTVLENVQGNMIGAFLLAIFVNDLGDLGKTDAEQNENLNKLTVIAKAVMLVVGMAALLKSATGRLTEETFHALISEKLEAKSEEDEVLLKELSPLVEAFKALREESSDLEGTWEKLCEALGMFFRGDPALEAIMDPVEIYARIAQDIRHSFNKG